MDKENLLIQTLGKEKFERIVDDISNLIEKENLNKSPTIIKDVFEYVLYSIF